MPDKRYHIHIICAPDDQVSMLDGLSLFMEKRAFLTRDLLQCDVEAASYSKRCIDSCDFIIVLLGDSYGALTNTGVSQMHLSYIYANTKAKPMMMVLKLPNNKSKRSPQLNEFFEVIERDHSDSVYYYDDDVKMQEYIEPAYRKFLAEYSINRNQGLGWKPCTNNSITHTKELTKKSVKNFNNKVEPSISRYSETKKLTSMLNSDTKINTEEKQISDISEADASAELTVQFTTQAFQGGNLSEVAADATLKWIDILQVIAKLPSPIGQHSFQRAVNDVVHQQALALVQVRMPEVHAVSRTNVMVSDLDWIYSQLMEFGWLQLKNKNTKSGMHTSYDILELTHKGKLALNSH